MPRSYRTASKRIIPRAGNGRFRTTTLTDIGMACCQKCGAIFKPDFSQAKDEGGFIDPLKFNTLKRICPDCGGAGEQTGMKVQAPR